MADTSPLRALCVRWDAPLRGARQRANTNEDFAEIAAEERVREQCAAELRAVLNRLAEGGTR